MTKQSALLAVALTTLVACSSGCTGRVGAGPTADPTAVTKLREAIESGSSGGGDAAEAAASPSGTGWGSLKGRFVFDGTAPELKAIESARAVKECGDGGHVPLDRSLIVDPQSKGIANVVVYARKVSRIKDELKEPPKTPLVFDQKECEFLSPVAVAQVNQEVLVKNSDPFGHNTNITGTGYNPVIPAGGSSVFKPSSETAMPVGVTCSIHPFMKAYMLFRANPYSAISGADGSFEIKDLPAGEEVELQVWHAHGVGTGGGLSLKDPALTKAVKWDAKGRFRIKLGENENKDLSTIVVPAAALAGG